MIPTNQSWSIVYDIGFKNSLNLITYILGVCPHVWYLVKIPSINLVNLNIASGIELRPVYNFEWKQSIKILKKTHEVINKYQQIIIIDRYIFIVVPCIYNT